MDAHRWLGASFTAALVAASFAACKSSGSTGGAGGAGTGGAGSGGAASSSSSASSASSTGAPDAGPLKCTGQSSTVPKGACDMFKQDCPDPAKTCRAVKSGGAWTTQCVAGGGLKGPASDCFTDSECAEHLTCVTGKCSPVCCRNTGEPCGGAICDISYPYGPYEAFYCHYAPKCTLFEDNACENGLDCHVEDASQGLATCAEPNGIPSPDLGLCTFINDCGDMQQCYDGDPSSTQAECHYYCLVSAPTGTKAGNGGCPVGQKCFTKWMGNSINFGIPGVGLCFPTGVPADAGADSGSDGGPDAGTGGAGGAGGAAVGGAGGSGVGGGAGGSPPKDAATD